MRVRRLPPASLFAIGLAALAVRVALVLATPHYAPFGDPADYERHAASIAAGHGFAPTGIASPGTPSAFRPPAYPLLLGALYAVVGVHPNAGRLLGALLGACAVVLLALLGGAVGGRRVGIVAGAAGAVFPPLVALNASLLSESLFLPLELAASLCVVALRRAGGWRWAVLGGLLCGVAAETRTVGILWLVPLGVAAVRPAPGAPLRVRARLLGALVVPVLVVLVPWTVRNAVVLHAFVPLNTQGGFTLAGQYNDLAGQRGAFRAVARTPFQVPSLVAAVAPLYVRHGGVGEAELDRVLRHQALAYIRRHPFDVVVVCWLSALRMFDVGSNHRFTTSLAYREMSLPRGLRGLSTGAVDVAAVLALMGVALRRAGRLRFSVGGRLVWALPALALAGTVPVVGTVRYRAPADPFILLAACAAVVAVVAPPARYAAADATGGELDGREADAVRMSWR